MGNTAEIFRRCPPPPSTNFDEFFILLANDNLRNTAEQLCNCGFLRDAFIFYFRKTPWMDELLEYFAACDTSGRSKVKDEKGSHLITYLASVGTLWTSKDERDPSFYLQTPPMPECSNSSVSSSPTGRAPFSTMRATMSNKLQILPVAMALAIGCYIRSGQLKRDKDSFCISRTRPAAPSSTVLSLLASKSAHSSSDTASVHSSSSRSRMMFSSKSKELDSTVPKSDFPTVVMVPPTSNGPEGSNDGDKLDAYSRLRGLIKAVIEEVGDAEYLDFLLVQRDDGDTSTNVEDKKLIVSPLCEELPKCSPSTSLVWLKQLFHFFESFPVAISIASTKRNKQATFPLVYINQVFESITQYKRTDVLGQNCRFLHSEEFTEYGQRDRIRDSLHDMVASRLGLTNVRKDGTPFYNLLSLQPIFRPILHNQPSISNELTNNKIEISDALDTVGNVRGDAKVVQEKSISKYTASAPEAKYSNDMDMLLYNKSKNDTELDKVRIPRASSEKPPKLDDSDNRHSNITIMEDHMDDDRAATHPSMIEYTFSHVVGIQYEMKSRDKLLMDDLQVVEDLIVLLYGILII